MTEGRHIQRKVRIALLDGVVSDFSCDRLTIKNGLATLWASGIEVIAHAVEDVAYFEFLDASPTTWSLDAARAKHRNAYAPWSDEEDALLLEMFDRGTSPADIGAFFGRKPSAVESRLEKLFERKYLERLG